MTLLSRLQSALKTTKLAISGEVLFAVDTTAANGLARFAFRLKRKGEPPNLYIVLGIAASEAAWSCKFTPHEFEVFLEEVKTIRSSLPSRIPDAQTRGVQVSSKDEVLRQVEISCVSLLVNSISLSQKRSRVSGDQYVTLRIVGVSFAFDLNEYYALFRAADEVRQAMEASAPGLAPLRV